jgi:DNA-binding CsgD family transcriptional regulator
MNEAASRALAGVIGCIGRDDFGSAALAHLSGALPLCWWSVYKLYPDRPPHLYTSGSCGADDHTGVAFRTYRDGIYERDQTFIEARERTRGGRSALTHWHSLEIPFEHRRGIYLRHGLKERASLVGPDVDGGLLAINLYRGERDASFTDSDLDVLQAWGMPLLATVQVHIRTGAGLPQTAPVAGTACLAGLPRREREVCEGMLRGWTYDGIAADLGISAGTVKTYRDRAFDRLGLHHRNELFAMALSDATN